MSPTKPFSKRKKPQTIVETIVGHANIILQALSDTNSRHAIVLWLDNQDHIELSIYNGCHDVRFYHHGKPIYGSVLLDEITFVEHIICNPNALFRLQQLSEQTLLGHNVLMLT